MIKKLGVIISCNIFIFFSTGCTKEETIVDKARYPSLVGDKLVYQSHKNDRSMVYSKNLKTKEEKLIQKSKGDIFHPIVSKDGKYLVYTEYLNNNFQDGNLYIKNLSNNETELISKGDDIFGAIATFSFDGKKVFYCSWTTNRENKKHPFHPSVFEYDITSKKSIIVKSSNEELWRPVHSSDDYLYYIKFIPKRKDFDIFRMNLKDKKEEALVTDEGNQWDVQVSSDGKLLVYANKLKDEWDLYLMNLSDKKKIRLTNADGNEWDAVFTKDNMYIYYAFEHKNKTGIKKIKNPLYKK